MRYPLKIKTIIIIIYFLMVIRFLFTRLLIQHQEEGISYKVDQSQVMWLMDSCFPRYMKEYTVRGRILKRNNLNIIETKKLVNQYCQYFQFKTKNIKKIIDLDLDL